MKFSISSSVLLNDLSHLVGMVPTSPSLPILENFLFDISGKTLRVTASDLRTTVVCELALTQSEGEGVLAVPARIFMETLRNLTEGPLSMSFDEKSYQMEIKTEEGVYRLATENAEEFPRVPVIAESLSVKLGKDLVLGAIHHTLYAVSKDDLRPAMNGVLVEMENKEIHFIATDGHRLVKYSTRYAGDYTGKMIIPSKTLGLLKRLLSQHAEEEVSIEFNPSNASFALGRRRIVTRLIEERFPDYKNVIKVENNNEVFIDRDSFLSSLKRATIFSNRTTHQVSIGVKGKTLTLRAEDLDFSNKSEESLSCEHTGEDIEMGFNADFLTQALSQLGGERVVLKLKTPETAGIVLPEQQPEDANVFTLIMPIMLNA